MPVLDRIKKAWNAFRFNAEKEDRFDFQYGPSQGTRPDRVRLRFFNERSIISAIYTRIAIDVASVDIRHVQLDEQGRYKDDVDSLLNHALTFEPNIDQGPRAFKQDTAMTLFDKGVAVIVPVDTIGDPTGFDKYEILTLRIGEIVAWYPSHVKINLYNEAKGAREEITLEKKMVAIVENPLYAVMNEPNSTLQRLIHKLGILDAVDEQSGSGKLDLIIQLPYVIKSEARRQQAEQRREDIEFQLKGSRYGIAYTDGSEKITQLNRPAENNLLAQIEFLTGMLYDQLGITDDVMSGTADEKVMINYYNRTIEPILQSIAEAMQRSFLGPLGAANGERVMYFRDPFRLVPISQIAEIADKFTRNEILSSNEIRGAIGIPPSDDPKADQLTNANMPQPTPLPDQTSVA